MSLKVFFYHGGDYFNATEPYTSKVEEKMSFLLIPDLYLKTHLEIFNPEIAKQVEWLTAEQHALSDEELIKFCIESEVDLLCTSHFLWNDSFLKNQLKRIKPYLNPKTIIVCGGPQLDVNVDPDFFNKNPFIDYAVYGAGEVAFSDLLTSLINKKKLIAFNTSNIAWQDKTTKKAIVANYKYVPQSKVSPYLYNEEFFSTMVQQEIDRGFTIFVPYELTRGCPYSCTFCDWNSGLGNKVSRRKNTYKDEIDLFQKLKIKGIQLADANVGQYEEDVDVIAYFAKKNIHENTGFFIAGNYSKLNLESNLKIFHQLVQGKLLVENWGLPIAIQEINPDILANIDRPSVGWNEYKKLIDELRDAYPDLPIKIQLVIGLPGQTPQTVRETLKEVTTCKIVITPFLSELLGASPAATSKEYQEKFKFKYSESLRYSNYSNSFFRAKFAESCYSFSQEDLVEMIILCTFYRCLLTLVNEARRHRITFEFNSQDIENTVDHFLESKEYTTLKENLFNNWLDDKFYYTINFDGSEMITTADGVESTAEVWINNKNFIQWLYNHRPDKTLFRLGAKIKSVGLSKVPLP
jgi:tRNA A37 methylthiotransferase MiaB